MAKRAEILQAASKLKITLYPEDFKRIGRLLNQYGLENVIYGVENYHKVKDVHKDHYMWEYITAVSRESAKKKTKVTPNEASKILDYIMRGNAKRDSAKDTL